MPFVNWRQAFMMVVSLSLVVIGVALWVGLST